MVTEKGDPPKCLHLKVFSALQEDPKQVSYRLSGFREVKLDSPMEPFE